MTIKSKAFKFLLGIAVVLGVAVSASLASAADFGTATLRVGSRGAAVMEVQKVVGAKPVDGIFGPMTMAAVKAWQANNGLEPDGVVGNYTKAAMNAVSEVVAPSSGCQAGWIVNPFTNQPCGTTTPTTPSTPTTPTTLKGGAGNLDVTSSTKGTENDVKEGNEEKVLALKLEADDSDIQVTHAKIVLNREKGLSVGSEKLADYVEEVKVYLGNKEVGSIDASDFTRKSGSPDTFTKSISLSNAIVGEDETEYLYVALVAISDLDTSDLNSALRWVVNLETLRYTDGTGAILSVNGDLVDDVNFLAGSVDDKMTLKSSSANPKDVTVKVYEDDTTDDVLALAFKLDVDDDSSDMDLQTIKVTATTNIAVATLNTVAKVENLIDTVTLKIAGEEFDAEDLVIGDLTLTDTYTVITYEFDIDGDVTIDAGDVEEAEVYVTFYEQGGTPKNYSDGSTVKFSVANAGIEAEVDGDEVDGTDIKGATQTGGLITLNSSAANVSNVKWVVSNAGTFLDLFFTVEADNDDFTFLANSIDDAISAGSTAVVVQGSTYMTDIKGTLSKYSGDATSVGTSTGADAGFEVNEGDKATFRVRYNLGSTTAAPVVTADNGKWLEVKVTSVAGQTVADDLQTSPTATVRL